MDNAKGQVATEYLIILAIVVIISLIAVGVMRSMVGFKSDFSAATSKIEWTSKEVVLLQSSLNAQGTDVIKVQNNANYPIIISEVGIGKEAIPLTGSMTIYPGSEQVIELSENAVVKGEIGNDYTLEVNIVYHDAEDSRLQSSISGMIYGVYQ